MALSIQDAITQNTVGYSEGRPLGVPSGFAWYNGVYKAAAAAPAGFTSVTAWGQVYQDSGEAASSTAAAKVQVANSKTYVHLKSTGDWVLVQTQDSGISGGFFRTDFAGQTALPMPVTKSADGTATFGAPPSGYNNHYWPTARGTFAANDVDAVYVQMDMRVTDPNVNLVAQIGADWWRSSTAPFVQGFSNNPTAGTANWIDLSTEWRTLAFTSSNAVLQADPPPPLVGAAVEVRPTVTSFSPDSATVGDGVTNAGAVTLNGTAKAGVSVAVFDGTTRLGTATANASGAWAYTTGQLSNASHSFTVKNLTTSGATGLASSALAVRVDTIAPATPKIVSFSPDTDTVGDGVTTASRLTLAGTAEAGSVVKIFDGTAQIGTATANASGQWSMTTAQLSNATHSFSARATDAAGNSSGPSLPLSVKVQGTTTTPTPTPDPVPSDGVNLLVNGSFEANTLSAGQWGSYTTMSGWTALSGSKIELWNDLNEVKASKGSNFGELDFLGADDGFYQSVKTVAGQSYNLSFDARSRPGQTDATCTVEVWWNDKLVASVPPGADWSSYDFTVTGTGGQDRLTFREARGQGGDGLGALYDNISLTAGAAAPPPPVSSNLLVNGSFEATPLASGRWGAFDSVAGWTAISGGTIELWNNLNGVQAANGQNFGELDYLGATDGLYQSVKTEAGQKYALSFDARSRPGVSAATTAIDVLWNDKVVARVPPGSDWNTHTFTVTGTGGQDRLTFREADGQGGDGLGALYDNVSLVATGAVTSSATAALDQSMTLMAQYSASAPDTSNVASITAFQGTNQENLAPTLTQTHQVS